MSTVITPRKGNIRKLIKALKSGDYKKGKWALHYNPKRNFIANDIPNSANTTGYDRSVETCNGNTRHCCLGVAECLMPPSARRCSGSSDSTSRYDAILTWLGLINGTTGSQSLISLNDHNDTFEPVIQKLEEILKSR